MCNEDYDDIMMGLAWENDLDGMGIAVELYNLEKEREEAYVLHKVW